MADIEVSRNVPGVQATPVAKPYQRSASIEVTGTPNYQGAVSEYAASSNWMSSLGSYVASNASSAIATKLGAEMGKNPQGDIGIPLTEFDKTLQQSYQTQAQATLGLQANKLITESNMELAKLPRITPDVMEKTHNDLSLGLQKIFSHAPAEIHSQLEYHYGNLLLNQQGDLTERMVREQRQDRKNNSALSSQTNAENAYSFGLKGNEKAAQNAIEITRKLNEADVASRITDPITAKANVDTVRKSYLNGRVVNEYETARASGKGEEFLKSLADKRPSYLSDEDYLSVTNHLMTYVNHQNSLRSQDESLRLARFETAVYTNPTAAASELPALRENLSAQNYEKAALFYQKALLREQGKTLDLTATAQVWNSAADLSRAKPESLNATFDALVTRNMTQHNDSGSPISLDDSQVQVAASAGVAIPVFNKELTNKLTSGNPVNIESAARQMQTLKDMKAYHAYSDVSKQAQAIALQFMNQKGSMPDTDLARKITENVMGVGKDLQPVLDNAWNMKLSSAGALGNGRSKSLSTFALSAAGIDIDDLGGKYFETLYGNDIYDTLRSNFDIARGDYDVAVEMTKDHVEKHYGYTKVNGKNQFTENPIEKALGYKDHDVVPYIHQDMMTQLENKFSQHKEDNDYWEVKHPEAKKKNTIHELVFANPEAPEVIRHIKGKDGKEKLYRYPVNLVGRPGNTWDVVLQTPMGPRNIMLIAPQLEVMTYKPDAASIRENYQSSMKKGLFR